MKFKQIPVDKKITGPLIIAGAKWVKLYACGEAMALYALEPNKHGMLHHLSISCADRYPTWDEIVAAKGQIMGDVDAMMVLPRKRDYVNVMTKCFHVWETPVEWGIQ